MKTAFNKKTVFSILLPILLSTVFLAISFAHGGENHGEKKTVAATGQMNVKVADLDAVELLVKYSTPKPAEEATLLVFLTDLKTNAPVAGANLSLAMKYVSSRESSDGDSSHVHAASQTLWLPASPADTPGTYQARCHFRKLGNTPWR